MRGPLLAAAALILFAAPANASPDNPDNPDGNDWAAIALSPDNGRGGYGSAGTREDAVNIALTQCSLLGPHCLLAQATEYGCVAYAVDKTSHAWAGGVGPDPDAAVVAAQSRMPDPQAQLYGGSHCSEPLTPP